jgi:Protein kinase domain
VESGAILAARYRLGKLLGGGGMGEVWQGHDLRLDREVAIKVMRDGVDIDPIARRRFQKEATIAARLQHPGITVVYDADLHEGRGQRKGKLFIITELLHGENLEQHLAAHPGPVPVSQVIGFALQLTDALAWAHENGVVHRDLKPSNIFIDARNRLKVCDFGIAAHMNAQSRVTQTGWTVGTPAYMAPEQWEGNPAAPSMDLYALGCILYLMLTGRLPFDGQSPPVLMRQHFNHRPVPPRDRNPQVPAGLNDLLLGLLAKDPHDRPGNARAVHATLTEIRDAAKHAPAPVVPATPPGAPTAASGPRDAWIPVPPAAYAGSPAPTAPPRVRRAALVACASSGQDSFDVMAVDRAGRVQGRMDFADGGGGNWGSGRWVTWFAASELPGPITALAEGLSQDGHWAIAAVADGVPYLKLNAQEPYRLCDPASSVVSLPVLDVAVLYGSGQPEVFALDRAGDIWHLSWPAGGWTLWDDSLAPAAATAIAMASLDYQALAAMAGTRLLIKTRTPHGSWSRWGGKNLGRRLLDTACSVSERHFAVFALDEAGSVWQGVYPLGPPASSAAGTLLGAWGTVAPPPGGVTGIAATVLDAQRGAADRGGLLVAMTSDGAVHSARYTLGAGSESRWSGWRRMPALD